MAQMPFPPGQAPPQQRNGPQFAPRRGPPQQMQMPRRPMATTHPAMAMRGRLMPHRPSGMPQHSSLATRPSAWSSSQASLAASQHASSSTQLTPAQRFMARSQVKVESDSETESDGDEADCEVSSDSDDADDVTRSKPRRSRVRTLVASAKSRTRRARSKLKPRRKKRTEEPKKRRRRRRGDESSSEEEDAPSRPAAEPTQFINATPGGPPFMTAQPVRHPHLARIGTHIHRPHMPLHRPHPMSFRRAGPPQPSLGPPPPMRPPQQPGLPPFSRPPGQPPFRGLAPMQSYGRPPYGPLGPPQPLIGPRPSHITADEQAALDQSERVKAKIVLDFLVSNDVIGKAGGSRSPMPSYGMMPGQTMMGGMNPAMAAMNMGAGPRGPGGQAGPGAVAKVDVPAGFHVVEPEESKNGRRRPPPQQQQQQMGGMPGMMPFPMMMPYPGMMGAPLTKEEKKSDVPAGFVSVG